MKPDAPSLQFPRLLDQVRERVRYVHYSLNIVKYYVFECNYLCVDRPMRQAQCAIRPGCRLANS